MLLGKGGILCLLFVQSEAEQECSSVKKIGSRNNSDFETGNDKDKRSLVRTRNSSDMADQKGLKTWSSRHLALEPSRDSALNSVQTMQTYFLNLQCAYLKVICGGKLIFYCIWDLCMFHSQSRSHPSTWDDEEKTIKVFCEQMKV